MPNARYICGLLHVRNSDLDAFSVVTITTPCMSNGAVRSNLELCTSIIGVFRFRDALFDISTQRRDSTLREVLIRCDGRNRALSLVLLHRRQLSLVLLHHRQARGAVGALESAPRQ